MLLDFLINPNAGFLAARLVSFVGLPPNSWSMVSEGNLNFDSTEKYLRQPSIPPVLFLLGLNQPLPVLFRIQKRLYTWYMVGEESHWKVKVNIAPLK